MAIPANIDDLVNVRVVESNRIEFKRDFNPAAVIRSICAFANDIDNTGGGYIILGVEEQDGSPKRPLAGIPQGRVDAIQKKLLEYCRYIEPLYQPIVEPVLYEGVYLIVIWIPGGFGRPYKAPKDPESKAIQKHYYIRKFSSSVVASADEEKELFYISSSIPFDDRPNLVANVSDLDIGLMREHLKETGSSLYPLSLKMDALSIARDMQLVDGPTEDVRPRNVGILMFSEDPQRVFRYARIEVADIPDPTGARMVEKVFRGPIQRQLRDALSYLRNYVLKEAVIKDASREQAERIFNFPYAAVEEILANAVYHRSYQISEPITVRITPEAIEVTSFPGFDRSISDEAIERQDIRARAYRNRRIGDFLKELGLIEGRNTGFPNAKRALAENGSGKLTFEMDPERSYLSVTIPIHEFFRNGSGADAKRLAYQERLLLCLAEKPLNLSELATAMGYKGITAKMRSEVDALLSQGRIGQVVDGGIVKYARETA